MKERGLFPKGDVIVSVSVKNPNSAKNPKRPKIVEPPSSVPPDSFQPKCVCRIDHSSMLTGNPVCLAAEKIDNVIVNCGAPTSGKRSFRASNFMPLFIPMCADCIKDLHRHKFCPGCGLKCQHWDYYECIVGHRHHVGCLELIQSDQKNKCPHCNDQVLPKIHKTAIDQSEPPPLILSQASKFKFTKEEEARLLELGKLAHSIRKSGIQQTLLNELKPIEIQKLIDTEDLNGIMRLCFSGQIRTTITRNKRSLFHYCLVDKRDLVLAELFLRFGSDPSQPDIKWKSALIDVVQLLDIRLVQYALHSGCRPDITEESGRSAFHFAAQTGNVDIMRLLFESNPAIRPGWADFTNYTIIMWAVESENPDMLEYLITHATSRDFAKVDNASKTALHWAAHLGKADFCKLILDFDPSLIDELDSNGNTPIHLASSINSLSTLRVLSKYKPDLNIKNIDLDRPEDVTKDTNCQLYLKLMSSVFELDNRRPTIPKRRKIIHDFSMGREVLPVPVYNSVDDTTPCLINYISNSRPSDPSLTVKKEINDSTSCSCRSDCRQCECVISSEELRYKNSKLNINKLESLEIPIIQECHDLCACHVQLCSNRVVQHGLQHRFEIFRTELKGWGLRSPQHIKKGSFVCEIVGEIKKYSAELDTPDYLIKLSELGDNQFGLDLTHYGNIGRFVNHSCEPNLVLVRVLIEHSDFRCPQVALFATRNIEPNEELAFDYGDIFWSFKGAKHLCHCQSAKCRYSNSDACRFQREKMQKYMLH